MTIYLVTHFYLMKRCARRMYSREVPPLLDGGALRSKFFGLSDLHSIMACWAGSIRRQMDTN
ncbi:hypothetical protein CAP40_10155 [Sphingomonas sp. IBVSS2]|nr:hypothetical protein CAP40_10155 [Sphingomonas sp. IBVSS2]